MDLLQEVFKKSQLDLNFTTWFASHPLSYNITPFSLSNGPSGILGVLVLASSAFITVITIASVKNLSKNIQVLT